MTKRTFNVLFCMIIAICFIVGIKSNDVSAATVKLGKTTMELAVGEQQYLKLRNASGDITWKTSDKNVVAIKSSGDKVKLTGKVPGTAQITATYNGKKYVCKVSVVNNIVFEVQLGKDEEAVVLSGNYTGKLDKNGQPTGKGLFVYETDNIILTYEGEFKKSKPHGFGSLKLVSEDSTIELVGHFIKGVWKPTLADAMNSIGFEYSFEGNTKVTSDVLKFIGEQESLDSKTIKKKSQVIDPRKLKKNIVPYQKSIDYVSEGYVQQIFENSDEGYIITEMLVSSNSYYYVVVYDGSIDVFEGDYIEFYGTPLGNGSFKNISGGDTLYIREYGYIINIK